MSGRMRARTGPVGRFFKTGHYLDAASLGVDSTHDPSRLVLPNRRSKQRVGAHGAKLGQESNVGGVVARVVGHTQRAPT
jgi:hypothetical protein